MNSSTIGLSLPAHLTEGSEHHIREILTRIASAVRVDAPVVCLAGSLTEAEQSRIIATAEWAASTRDYGAPVHYYLCATESVVPTQVDSTVRDRVLEFPGDIARLAKQLRVSCHVIVLGRLILDSWSSLNPLFDKGTLVVEVEPAKLLLHDRNFEMLNLGEHHRILAYVKEPALGRAQVPDDVFRFAVRQLGLVPRAEYCAGFDEIARPLRVALAKFVGNKANYGSAAWPYSRRGARAFPTCLPNGSPWPRISIVTPCFNSAPFIEETILSVLNQGYPNLEYFITDGGSDDGTVEIVQRYADRLTGFVSEPDRGQSDAINKGFGKATGEIFGWINADDMLAPEALFHVAFAFHSSSADLVAGTCQVLQGDVITHEHLTASPSGRLPLDEVLDLDGCWLKGQFFHQPEVLFTRKLWEAAGATLNPELYYSMDYDLWVRFAEQSAKLTVIGRPVAIYRVHKQQKTYTPDTYKGELQELNRVYRDKHADLLKQTPRRIRSVERPRCVLMNDIGFNYGAGIAQRRISEALSSAGVDCFPLAAISRTAPDLHSARVTGEDVLEAIAEVKPDFVIFGNLHAAALHPGVVGLIAEKYPTLLMLHDMWLLTGRCAYSGNCLKYETSCDETCPTFDQYPALPAEKVASYFESKRLLNELNYNLLLVTNSNWMTELAKQFYPRLIRDGSTIFCPLPTHTFTPGDKATCRRLLGLPADRFMVLFSASDLADERKGMRDLLGALRMCNIPDILAVAMGGAEISLICEGIDLRCMGYQTDPLKLQMLYAAADVFVGPSKQEAFGQVFLEAAACGTASIGYPIGGIPDALCNGTSGLLASGIGPEYLAAAIKQIYCDQERRAQMESWGRIRAENEFSYPIFVNRIFQQIQNLLKGSVSPNLSFELTRKGPHQAELIRRGFAFSHTEGIGEPEGPYPDRGLPHLRWAWGPRSAFRIRTFASGRAVLLLRLGVDLPGQTISIVHNGKPLGTFTLTESYATAPVDKHLFVPVEIIKPDNQFVCEYATWHGADKVDSGRAVMIFSAMVLDEQDQFHVLN